MNKLTRFGRGGGQHSTMVSILASGLSCSWVNSQLYPIVFEEKIVNVAEVNQRLCLEESEQKRWFSCCWSPDNLERLASNETALP